MLFRSLFLVFWVFTLSAEAYSQKKSVEPTAVPVQDSLGVSLQESSVSSSGPVAVLPTPVQSSSANGDATFSFPSALNHLQHPPSLSVLKKKRKGDVLEFAEGVKKAVVALKQDPFSEKGVWDLRVFEKNPLLKKRLQEFQEGKVGAYLKALDTKKTPYQEIRKGLLANGFVFKTIPLMAKKRMRRNPGHKIVIRDGRYVRQDGTHTEDPADPNLVMQEMYLHPDGSMVRIKLHGEPDGKRPQPHVIKTVLLDPQRGTGYNNEAFKVTWDGKAVPKGPNVSFGLKSKPDAQSSDDERRGWVDLIMQESHRDLVLTQPETPKKS